MIHLIVGNTGSGKTTYASELKLETNGIIFSIDTWNKTLFLDDKQRDDGLEWFLERIERAEKIIMSLVDQLENANTDTILDLGFSKFKHREKFRIFAIEKGFETQTHFLDIPKATRLHRILQRNLDKGDTFEFEVSQENFNFMERWFEKPNAKEMTNGIIITE
ncbi:MULTISPECIES: AAA family ATPase [Bizionia]|uniref:ATP-binding protein n=1 Tax=Bizionia algoritergicola TaxID=291187 RepID=A0A5D0QTY6_9FLAO|nr:MULTISPECIES: ATP-binding protein [Bizionia]OBX22983.1 Zeta toxin [Bizionia sp. APA-3]TYB72703.1 ATP-binding protein [Bizionia algoritergicola]